MIGSKPGEYPEIVQVIKLDVNDCFTYSKSTYSFTFKKMDLLYQINFTPLGRF